MICCFFSSFKTFAMLREATYPPAAVNVLDVSSESMAAFQVFLYGRFWVFTEALIVLDFAVLEIVAADLSFFMMPQYGTQFKTCYQILPSCPKASLLGMEHFAHGGQISSNWTVQKRKRRSGLCLTASASYYYRRFDRTLVRPDEDATLRKCLQFLRVLIVLRPDGCREDAKTA
jgi:hypothetical protein